MVAFPLEKIRRKYFGTEIVTYLKAHIVNFFAVYISVNNYFMCPFSKFHYEKALYGH